MKLNLGSGQHPTDLDGWLDVDLPWYGVDHPDVYADMFCLPFPEDSFDAAYIGHVMEHVEWEAIPFMGVELKRVLRPGAEVMVVGPDMAKAIDIRQPYEILKAILGEPPEGPGGHKWIPTELLTIKAVERLGLSAVQPVKISSVTPPSWPNVSCAEWQTAVQGWVP